MVDQNPLLESDWSTKWYVTWLQPGVSKASGCTVPYDQRALPGWGPTGASVGLCKFHWLLLENSNLKIPRNCPWVIISYSMRFSRRISACGHGGPTAL